MSSIYGNDEHTLLLLHGEDLTDSSQRKAQITNNGVIASDAQSKFGGSSLYFNGSSYLSIHNGTMLNGESFTVDWWEYRTSSTAWATTFHQPYADGNNNGFVAGGPYNGNETLYISTNGSSFDVASQAKMGNTTVNAWVHRALVRNGNQILAFENGKLVNTIFVSVQFAYSGNFVLGKHNNCFIGYIDEFRISSIARWTEDFTPPTEPYKSPIPPTPPNFRLSSSTETTATLAWSTVDGAAGYKLYRDGILIATLTDTSYTDVIQPFTHYVYTLTAYNEHGEGDAAELVVFLSPGNPILWLVTDRTQEDVTARNSKGVYQAVDLNRVGAAVEYLQKRLFAAGVLADVSPRTDWTDSMWMSAGEAQVYLDNVKTMRAALAMPKGTPTAPNDMAKLTYAEANHMELFLVILDTLLTDMVFAYRHCGVTTCGMGGLIL